MDRSVARIVKDEPQIENEGDDPSFEPLEFTEGEVCTAFAGARCMHTYDESRLEDDAILVAALLSDCDGAWRRFRARYDHMVRSWIRRVMLRFGVTCRTTADDLHGAFYLSLLADNKRKLRSFDPSRGHRLASWLKVVVSHATYDAMRKWNREPNGDPLDHALGIPSDAPTPCGQLVALEDTLAVVQSLEQLSARDRAFTDLYLDEEMPPEEVARRMEISVKTVYSKWHKIVLRLRQDVGASPAAA